ncbi:MAG: transcription termination/antitermination protein NusG [Clostridiales Family XIII bacterium]|jgi:transcriptional antiterminator NusG|nr:transcription termination/antitermination protein NusG [Clostridiales Family XIII bacterium]
MEIENDSIDIIETGAGKAKEPVRATSAQIFAQDVADDVYDESDIDSPRWYVIHTYSGHESKVKQNIEKLVENSSEESRLKDKIIKVVVPTEDYVEMKDGQRKLKVRKTFPGYVLIKMKVDNESWYLVRNTQGVTGFVGHGIEPVPLTKEEVRRMGIEKVYIELDINVGDSIKVINGPFEGVTGVVEEVNPEKEVLKARISMFGRDTSVELVYDQVEQL